MKNQKTKNLPCKKFYTAIRFAEKLSRRNMFRSILEPSQAPELEKQTVHNPLAGNQHYKIHGTSYKTRFGVEENLKKNHQ